MPKRSNPFQRIVALLTLQTASKHATVTESKMLADRITGDKREVDIVIETKEAGYPLIISIETVSYSRPASVEWIDRMVGKHKNLPTNKLILISQSGFARSALAKARLESIDCITFEEALEADWQGAVELAERGIFHTVEFKITCEAEIERSGIDEQMPIPLNSSITLGPLSEFRNSNVITALDMVQNVMPVVMPAVRKAMEANPEHPISLVQHLAQGSTITCDAQVLPVKRIRFRLRLSESVGIVSLTRGRLGNHDLIYGSGNSNLGDIEVVQVRGKGTGMIAIDGAVMPISIDAEEGKTFAEAIKNAFIGKFSDDL